jgi:uncharacterized protein (DUF4415 family)
MKFNLTLCYRRECAKVRQDIGKEKDEDKRAAFVQLSKMKDEEMQANKEGWQIKMNELLEEVCICFLFLIP